jgi:hypothetical protein
MTRPRRNCIKVYVKDDELSRLVGISKSANLPLSGYLRAVGLNMSIKQAPDPFTAADLARINGGLGRIAEALTQSNDPGLRKLVNDIRDLQTLTHEIMGRMRR